MKYILDLDDIKRQKQELIDMTAILNIHGHINSRYKKQRKPVVSQIGKECAIKIIDAVFSYLDTYKET